MISSLDSSNRCFTQPCSIMLDPLRLSGHELRFVVDAKPQKDEFIKELKAALLTWCRLACEAKNFILKTEEEAWELAIAVKKHIDEKELELFTVFDLKDVYPTHSLLALADRHPELFGKALIETEFYSARICEVI